MLNLFEAKTKNSILRNAILLFAQSGYSNVSMRQIALACNIQAASIYFHFENKNAIMDAVFDYFSHVLEHTVFGKMDILKMIDSSKSTNDILNYLFFIFPEEEREYCACCIKIFYMEQFINEKAKNVLTQIFYSSVYDELKLCLQELVNRKRIKEMDVEKFADVWARCVFFFTFQEAHKKFDSTKDNDYSKFIELNQYLINYCVNGVL